MSVIYMDNNATTRVDPAVLEEMLPYFSEQYGNPSSMHTFGGKVGRAVEDARERTAELMGAEPGEIVFTACGTEGDNAAIRAALAARPDKRRIITTRVEHPAVLALCKDLEDRGYHVTWLPVDGQGLLDLEQYRRALGDDVALISAMAANNETGALFPVAEMAEMAREKGILFHTDAVQAVGKIPLDMNTVPADYATISAHKIHGPKGVGALYVRKGAPFTPFLVGGHQERGRRAGTENTPGVVGLGKAAQLAAQGLADEATRVRALRDRLETALLEGIPHSRRNGPADLRLPNTTSVAFKHVEGEAILLMMDQLGICANSGSACTSGSLEPSHVLRAMGVPFTYAHGSIRYSLSRFTTDEEVDAVAKAMPGIIERLRQLSPFTGQDDPPACTC